MKKIHSQHKKSNKTEKDTSTSKVMTSEYKQLFQRITSKASRDAADALFTTAEEM